MEAQSGAVRFGPYEVRPATRELVRHGVRVRLPPQAFEVLRLLLERHGALVTRQKFHQALWPADTFVDFDQGLNNAIKRIREALNDSSESPTYIETLPRLGYRFIGTVELNEPALADAAQTNGFARPPTNRTSVELEASVAKDEPPSAVVPVRVRKVSRRWWALAALAVLLAGSLVLAWESRPWYPKPRITGGRQLTTDGIPKWGPLATDGQRVFFTETLNGRETIAAVPITGGQAVPLKMPFVQAGLFGISPDKNDLLVAETSSLFEEKPLWRVPVIGGTPRRLGNIAAHDANWSPDGTRLAYTNGGGVYVANADGSDPRVLLPPSANHRLWAWRPTWSSDSRRLRFDLFEMDTDQGRLWEISADGTNPHPVFPVSTERPMQAFGDWTSDDTYYVFSAWNERESFSPSPAANLWAVREKASFFHRASPLPTSLTTGPIRYFVHTLSPDGKTIFALSSLKHGELMRYDAHAKTFSPWLSGLSAEGVTFSRDGNWIAYVTFPMGELWRSRIDGSEPLRLSSQPLFAATPAWSPDGNQIAFIGMYAGQSWHSYRVSADGGEPRRIDPIGEGADPTWSPDGNFLVFKGAGGETGTIQILNLQKGTIATVAGSRGFNTSRMSPDGRWIVALSSDIQKLLVFNLRTQAWTELARGSSITWPQWSSDSRYVYFARIDHDVGVFRVAVTGGEPKRVVSLKDFRGTGLMDGWFALTPQNDVLVLHDTGGGTEIYALTWEAP